MKKKNIIIIGILILLVLTGGVFFYLKSSEDIRNNNYPYEPDTPTPDPHDGTFVSEHGKMTFNGDGKTLSYDFDKELADLCNLPEGKHEGTYVFLSGNLPPHGSIDVRYDIAHEWRIETENTSSVIRLGLASEDGKTGTVGVNMVTESRIPFLLDIDDGVVSVVFEKE